jgi:plastocyanin
MKNTPLIVAVVAILLIAGIGLAVVMNHKSSAPASTTSASPTPEAMQMSPTDAMPQSKGMEATGSQNMDNTKVTQDAGTATETKVSISGFKFDPVTLTVKKGTKVTWTNMDSVGHNVVASDKSFSSETLQKGDSFSHVFDKTGTFAYVCTFHPNMKATVIVQ